MRKCLITGGAGFIGSNLADFLLKKGEEVIVMDNLFQGKAERLSELVDFIELDMNEINWLMNADQSLFYEGETFWNEKIDVIFHLGALARIQPSFKNPFNTMDVNVMGTTNVLELARKTGAKVVYAGSSSVYFNPYVNPYAFSKWLGEEVCKMYNVTYGVKTAIARFFNVYGPNQPKEGQYATVVGIFEKQVIDNKFLTVTGDGQKRRDFTHVYDIVNGLYQMSLDEWNGEIFNLGTGTNHSILEIAQMFQKDIEFIPERPGEADITLADIAFTQEKLDWKPTIKIENYVKTFINQVNTLLKKEA